MQEFWHRFMTNRYWFVGTLVVVSFIVLFFWHLLDPVGYASEINSWMNSLKELFYNLISLIIVGIVIVVVWKRLFPTTKKKGH